MATTVINAYTIAFPTITNRIEADIATQANPGAIIASQIFSPPHPTRIISFPGLARTNYTFTLNEIDGAGAILRQLAFFDIVPGDLLNGIFRPEEQIRVGQTTGLIAGTRTFTFDGTGGKPDWRNWDISPEVYSGVGTLIRGTDYSWDIIAGTFNLLPAGLTFDSGQYYTVEFQPQSTGGVNPAPTVFDFSLRVITADTTLLAADFGTKILVEPSGNSLILTLPTLASCPAGRSLMLETQSIQAFKCVQIKTVGTDVIKWQFGGLWMMMNESLYIYNFAISGRSEWRVFNLQGNFDSVGRLTSSDLANVYNKVPLDGANLDKNQYGRLYNEVVLRLPVNQVVNYDNWSGNQTFYSLANSANPANLNKFHVPNRLGYVEKINVSPRIVGSYEPDAVGAHTHDYKERHANSYTGDPTSAVAGSGAVNPQDFNKVTLDTGTGMSTETKVRNYSINKYILV